jgi:23S rRNA (cytosine1962-C5)-methyltransferase
LFPEQLPHWEWMLEGLRRIKGERPRVLNLFAYTGVASLLAAAAGAEVTHVDASKKAIAWAKENQAMSRLSDAPIRWILDDARKFVAREARRARTYHAILVDPPKFGRGPNNEIWELFAHLPELMRNCCLLLNRSSAQLCLTVYAIRASALAFDGLARELLGARGGSFESGELAVIEEAGARAIGTSLFTRWSSDDLAR